MSRARGGDARGFALSKPRPGARLLKSNRPNLDADAAKEIKTLISASTTQVGQDTSVSPIRRASRPAKSHTAMKTVSTHAGGGALRAPAAAPAADVHNWEEF
jgi:hypothetical protein